MTLEQRPAVRQRTVGVWLILGYALTAVLSAPFVILDTSSNLNIVYDLMQLIAVVLLIAGSVALFRLESRALTLFVASFLVSLFPDVYYVGYAGVSKLTATTEPELIDLLKPNIVAAVLLTAGIEVAIVWYLLRLRRRAILR